MTIQFCKTEEQEGILRQMQYKRKKQLLLSWNASEKTYLNCL